MKSLSIIEDIFGHFKVNIKLAPLDEVSFHYGLNLIPNHNTVACSIKVNDFPNSSNILYTNSLKLIKGNIDIAIQTANNDHAQRILYYNTIDFMVSKLKDALIAGYIEVSNPSLISGLDLPYKQKTFSYTNISSEFSAYITKRRNSW